MDNNKPPSQLDDWDIKRLRRILVLIFDHWRVLTVDNYLRKFAHQMSLPDLISYIKSEIQFLDDERKKLDLVLFLYYSSNYSLRLVEQCYDALYMHGPRRPREILDKKELIRCFLRIPPNVVGEELREMQRRFYHEERKVAVSEVEQNIGGHGVYLVFEKVIDRPDFKILEDKILDFVRVKPGTDDNHVTVEGIEISVRKWPEIRSGLVIVQQLQALVTVLDDFVALIKCGYRHPLSIVRIGKHQSELNMTNQGIPVDRASVIYSGAVRVVSYKEGILIKALAARGSRSDNSIKQLTATPNTPSAKEINLSTEFGMESMGCEECAATTGPAAFFVYLLQTLNSIAVHTGNGNNTTLKDALFARRPDLETLELSCANIKVLIPYIDLVNEVLEAVLWETKDTELQDKGGTPLKIPSFNMKEGDGLNSHIARPMNTNINVYRDVVKKMTYPMHIFPYNQAIQSSRAYFRALGVSRYELLSKLQSPYSVSHTWLDRSNSTPSNKLCEAQATLDHAMAAEAGYR